VVFFSFFFFSRVQPIKRWRKRGEGGDGEGEEEEGKETEGGEKKRAQGLSVEKRWEVFFIGLSATNPNQRCSLTLTLSHLLWSAGPPIFFSSEKYILEALTTLLGQYKKGQGTKVRTCGQCVRGITSKPHY
jgi:hypothetical protein